MTTLENLKTQDEAKGIATLRTSDGLGHVNYREPKISVDRMSKSIACFDGFNLVRPFQQYNSEPDALKEAHDWFKTRTIHVPQVIFPMIRKMRVS